jgi:hypothetical protein
VPGRPAVLPRLADLLGRRQVLAVGLALFGIAPVL